MQSESDLFFKRSNSTGDRACEKCKKRVREGVSCGVCGSVSHPSCAVLLRKCCGVPLCDEQNAERALEENQLETVINILRSLEASHSELREEVRSLRRENVDLKSQVVTLLRRENASQNINTKTYASATADGKNLKNESNMLTITPTQQVESGRFHRTGAMRKITQNKLKPDDMGTGLRPKIVTTNDENRSEGNKNIEDNSKVNSNDWEVATLKQKTQRKKIMGSQKDNSHNSAIQGVRRRTWISVGRVRGCVQEETMINYIMAFINDEEIECTKMTTRCSNSSFKIGTDAKHKDALLRAENWPEGVLGISSNLKLSQLETLLTERCNDDIICLMEHWLRVEYINLVNFNNFKLASFYCRQDRARGGTLILVN
ncbi:hypothetical protein ABEB36_009330 [Hypothenemus hampei]|uniref:Phorbol-ester/DAG-type domain-containing protein n=1 Tax=Hypothenemus hampei TaxID=57062 RepID=A0ABD1EIY3_HYPHA